MSRRLCKVSLCSLSEAEVDLHLTPSVQGPGAEGGQREALGLRDRALGQGHRLLPSGLLGGTRAVCPRPHMIAPLGWSTCGSQQVKAKAGEVAEGDVKSHFFLLRSVYVLKCEVRCQKSNDFMGPLASEHPRSSPGAGNREGPPVALHGSVRISPVHEHCSPQGSPACWLPSPSQLRPGERKHATCWQRPWERAPGSLCQVPFSNFIQITLP